MRVKYCIVRFCIVLVEQSYVRFWLSFVRLSVAGAKLCKVLLSDARVKWGFVK